MPSTTAHNASPASAYRIARRIMTRRLLHVLFLAAVAFTTARPDVGTRAQDTSSKSPAGHLYFVAIGQQSNWQFLPEGFARVVRDQGKDLYKEIHGRVLVGPTATKQELLDALDDTCARAQANDLVMVFIACHGNCTAGGESVFATNRGTVRPREIKTRLGKLPCPAIVVNDACQSGNWPKEFDGDPMPPNVTALCCCLATQNSGIEFDITLFEALYGKADFNCDGVVDVDEVIRYCGLRIREVQGGKLTPVLHKAKGLTKALPLTKANPDLISVVHKREVFAAVVERQDGETYVVRVIGFDKPGAAGLGGGTVPNRYSRANVIPPGAQVPLMAKKGDGWHPACLVGTVGEEYTVRFIGWTRPR
jgi:hypothetical protein